MPPTGPGLAAATLTTMTIKLIALILLCLMTGTAVAQEPKVTSLMSKGLPENHSRASRVSHHAPANARAQRRAAEQHHSPTPASPRK